jgi:radical SAM protein with 4Fe4S-binding SPASM domain
MQNLHVISWNVTRSCNLACSHCYLPAAAGKATCPASSFNELTTREAFLLIDRISLVNPEVMLILSGGEPLLREDLFELSTYATGKGMMVVLGSNGLLIDDAAAKKMRQSGVSGISISLDSVGPEIHDSVRSCAGAWEKAVAAIRRCRDAGLAVQINAVVTTKNYNEMPALISFSRSLGAKVFSPFFLVCTGRGEKLTDLSPAQYEQVLSRIVEEQKRYDDMKIRTRCAPTLRRILNEKNPRSSLLKTGAGQCRAGSSYCRISPEGDVTACPYMPVSAGNVREREFKDIWEHSELFDSLRNPALKGKCGQCVFRLLCGGCRARAYAAYKDHLAEDPWCAHVPAGGEVIQPPSFGEDSNISSGKTLKPVWTAEAEDRLKKVPSFVRAMVRSAVERYAIEKEFRTITPDLMEELKQKAGLGGMHGHRHG